MPLERPALERLLIDAAHRAICVEAWGEFYIRAHIGVHQIHSRRASHAVPREVIGQDGAIRFYFRESNTSEMMLFKFDWAAVTSCTRVARAARPSCSRSRACNARSA